MKMNQTKIEQIIKRLENAVEVCRDVDSASHDYEKTYPFAAGYSRSAMQQAVEDLRSMLDK